MSGSGGISICKRSWALVQLYPNRIMSQRDRECGAYDLREIRMTVRACQATVLRPDASTGMAEHAITDVSHGIKKVATETARRMQGKRRRNQRSGCRLSRRASRGTVTSHGLISAGQRYWTGMCIGVPRPRGVSFVRNRQRKEDEGQ